MKKHRIFVCGSEGIVGSAHVFGFNKLGHQVTKYDLKLPDTKIEDCFKTEIAFICVPTPNRSDGSCDSSTVEDVVEKLYEIGYAGIVCIKSTISPGTTEKLINFYKHKKHNNSAQNNFHFNICFSSEHLRERSAISDFVENNELLCVGTYYNEVFEIVQDCYGYFPKRSIKLLPTQAELLKYFANVFGAYRVSLANEFYDICEKLGQDYSEIKEAFVSLTKIPNIYFDVNPNTARSYDSICWNKDVPALVSLAKSLDLELPLLYNIENSNNRHNRTPFVGTRSHY